MTWVTAGGKATGRIGQGTWYLGENRDTFDNEKEALRQGIAAGMNLLDTAEMYGDGAAEKLVGAAIQGYDRKDLYLVSKVLPWHAGGAQIEKSCEASLERMGTDYIDLYLLHWRGDIPLQETVAGMEKLKQRGLIREWGVSNFDTEDMRELNSVMNGNHCIADQVLYHLGSRGIEYDLLPWLHRHNKTTMAYCPLAQNGRLRQGLMDHKIMDLIADMHHVTPAQILLAYLLTKENVVPIPRTSKAEHALENAAAMKVELHPEDLAMLDRAFPAPDHKVPLDME